MEKKIPYSTLQTELLTVTGNPKPCSIGYDGYIYAAKGGVICRTNDGFANVEDGQDFDSIVSGAVVTSVTKSQSGYIVVCQLASNTGAIYYSESFDSGFSQVQAMAINANNMSISWHNDDNIGLVAEYSGLLDTTHNLYLSVDGGATWSTSYTTVIVDSEVASHIHKAVYDSTSQKMFMSVGDGANRVFLVSDDLGSTWSAFSNFEVNAKDTDIFNTTTYNFYQPTLMIPTSRGLALMPDIVFTPSIMTLDRGDIWKLSWNYTVYWGASVSQFFAKSPYATNNNEYYFIYPNNADPTQHFVVGSGDGGNTWHTLAEISLTSVGNMNYGIVGCDTNGYMYAYYKDSGQEYIWKAKSITWIVPKWG